MRHPKEHKMDSVMILDYYYVGMICQFKQILHED